MQRLKNAIKKIAIIGVGAAMLGATITSALAADLSEYPAPFVVNGEYDNSNAIVVGADAASSDTLGAVDIVGRMQFDAKKAVSTGGGTLSAVGGVAEDIPIDRGIANDTAYSLEWDLDDTDVSSFQDTAINFKGADYDIEDHLILHKGSPSIETSLTSGDDDYESNVFMESTADSIRYYYMFSDPIIPNNATTTDPLTLKFLGKTLKITKVDSGGKKITAYVGNEYFMKVGDSVTIDGKKITLSNVGSGGSIVMDVDGTIETIPASTTETVNGIEIVNDETFYEDTKSERSAHLIIGEDAQGTFEDGEEFIGEDPAEPNWVWEIENMFQNSATSSSVVQNTTGIIQGVGPILGVKNYFTKNDDTDNPAGIGECYDLPNNYASICLDSLTVPDEDYLTVTIEYASGEDTTKSTYILGSTSAKTIKISAPGEERFKILAATMTNGNGTANDADVKTSKVWLQPDPTSASAQSNIMVYYYDKNKNPTQQYIGNLSLESGSKVNTTGFMNVNYKDTKDTNVFFDASNITFGGTKNMLWVLINMSGDSSSELPQGADNLVINFTLTDGTGVSSLGDTAATEEADELYRLSRGSLTSLGTKDEDHRTIYGVIVKDPKSNGASDKVVLEIPGDQVQANVVVKGQATTVSGGATSYVPAKIDVDTLTDVEVTDPTAHNLILVGGPCANKLAASVGGLTCDGWKLASGEALIKLVSNGAKVALVVAGTEAMDTRMACKVLANYEDYKLETTEQIVTGTISAPVIKTA